MKGETSNKGNDRLVVGQEILDRNLIVDGNTKCLKNSSFDLTIGEIFPVGMDGYNARKKCELDTYVLNPRETVWVLSEQEFKLPYNVTGLAFLRTTYTRQGIFALNTGIVDPHYSGPISTVLLNFSRKKVEIKKGESFFRMIFIEHADVTKWKPNKDESRTTKDYQKELSDNALNIETKNFLDIPEFDQHFYSKTAAKMLWGLIKEHKILAAFLGILVLAPILYVWTIPDYISWFEFVRDACLNLLGKTKSFLLGESS